MRRLSIFSGVGFLAFIALLASTGHLPAQTAAPALTGKVTAEQGALEGVLVSAKKERLHRHHHGGERQRRPLQLPGRQAGTRPIFAAHSGGRLRPRQFQPGLGRGGQDRDRRSRLAQDRRPGGAAVERRMAGQHARHRCAEGPAAQLRRLPHAGAPAALEIQRRRVHDRRPAAHAGLCEPKHSGSTRSCAAPSA